MSIKEHFFKNGCHLIYQKSPLYIPLTNISFICDFGSIHEPEKCRGIAHFIEHLCFKSTKQHPNYNLIFNKYGRIGNYINATTDKQYTIYTLTQCPDELVNMAIQFYAEILFFTRFNQQEIEKEYDVVLEELVNDNNDGEEDFMVEIDKIIYKNTPYENGVDLLKYHTKDGKKSPPYKKEEIQYMYNLFYQPDNFRISVVSPIPFNSILNMLKISFFSKIKKSNIEMIQKRKQIQNRMYSTPATQNDLTIQIINKKENIVRFGILFKTCSILDEDYPVLEFIRGVFSNSFTSRFFLQLREKHHLVYGTNVLTDYTERTGGFYIIHTIEQNKIVNKQGILPIVLNILRDFRNNGITEDELMDTKNYLRSVFLQSGFKGEILAEHNGDQWLRTKVPYNEIFDTFFEPITHKRVVEVLRKYFIYERMSICIIGEELSKTEIENICRKNMCV